MVDVIVIGAGAAGLMCAREAAARGRSVVLLEGNSSPGEKIRISGGGRCNFTNIHASPEHFLSSNSGFCISALSRYRPDDFIALLEEHGIAYHEKVAGQLFCDGSARQIVDVMVSECTERGVVLCTGSQIGEIGKNEHFCVRTGDGEVESLKLVVATGGVSIPSLGATDFGYRVAKKFGINVITPKPGLVPLVLAGQELDFCRTLSGVSLRVNARCGATEFCDDLLFTHRGISGPAILQLSSFWEPANEIVIDVLPAIDIFGKFEEQRQTRKEIRSILNEVLPKRFVELWCTARSIAGMVQDVPKAGISAISQRLHEWIIHPVGTEGFGKAEVTVGGVDTRSLSSKTMEANHVPGLYFIGETVDVTGQLGGYNFQWAWASGAAAGRAI